MKKITILILSALSIIFISCSNNNALVKVNEENVKLAQARDIKSSKLPIIKFDKTAHDFGTIKEGDVVETNFKFTNVGEGDLVITNAASSCGCTIPNLKDIKGKIFKTGESGSFSVKFNSQGKPNKTTKTVTITANTTLGKETVKITAFATPDPQAAAKRKKAQQERVKKIQANKVKAKKKPLMLQG